jgi:hypothetical protein
LIWTSSPAGQTSFRSTPAIELAAGSNFDVSEAISTWYATQVVANGASSVLYINGTSNSGSAGTNAIAASNHPRIGLTTFSEFLDGKVVEVGVWGSAFTAPQQSSMNSNQRAYWGF